ncbi:MAG TPA: acyltransferase family protein, partial [Pseudomonadales bacterium]|nr:acyltransferase family protein [Pseudomonadales bacterium]
MKINDIEVLRCFSIIAVLLQHAANLFPYKVPIIEKIQHYLGGSFGVDLFFTISGFLVAQSLIKKL